MRLSSGRGGNAGFTMIELLVSMVVAAVLMLVLGRAMSAVMRNAEVLQVRLAESGQYVTLRRLFHRDVARMSLLGDMQVTSDGLAFDTTHMLLRPEPIPCTVQWTFSTTDGVVRREYKEMIDYDASIRLLPELEDWDLELYMSNDNSWTSLASWAISLQAAKERMQWVRAFRLTLRQPGGQSVQIVERLPDVLFANE